MATGDFGPVAFKMDGVSIYQVTIDSNARATQMRIIEEKRQDPNSTGEVGPAEIVSSFSQAVDTSINAAALLSIAAKEGIELGPDEINDWVPAAADRMVEEQVANTAQNREIQVRMADIQLEQLKKEKGETSEEYLAAQRRIDEMKGLSDVRFFETVSGQKIPELKQQILALYRQAMNERGQYQSLQAEMAADQIRRKWERAVDTSDAALKKSYDKVTYQQIYFEAGTSGDAKARAAEALEKIRGGMDFKAAIDEYSDMRPSDSNMKPSEVAEQTLDRYAIEAAGSYKVVLDLEPGGVSDVVELPTGAAVYKLVKIEPGVPEDFEAQKAKRANDIRTAAVAGRINDGIEQTRKTAKIEWESEAFRLLHEYDQIVNPTGARHAEFAGAENQTKRLMEFRTIFEALREAEANSPDLVASLRYVCFEQIDSLTPAGPDKDQLNEERLQVYADVASFISSSEFKFQYLNVLLAAKMGDQALEQLLDIATNATLYNPSTFPNVEKVEALLPRAIEVATPNSPVIDQVKAEIELAKQNAEEAKKLEEEEKRLQEEAERQANPTEGQETPETAPPGG